jgi:hypothetical protein
MNKDSLQTTIKKNQLLPCSVQGCPYSRHRLYSVCLRHQANKAHWGDPKAQAIQKKELRGLLSEVRSLVERNEVTHAGLQNALRWFDRWLTDAGEGKQGVTGSSHIARLYDHGVTGRHLLITCGAVWLFSYRNPHRLPTEKALAFALAHQVMKMVPLEYATTVTGKRRAIILSRKDRQEIGEYIRRSLGLLYTNMVASINETEDRERTFVNEMGKRFE